jgi:hypothetical protein
MRTISAPEVQASIIQIILLTSGELSGNISDSTVIVKEYSFIPQSIPRIEDEGIIM